MAGIIGLYLWMIQSKSVDAQEILNKAQNAQALSTNSGIYTFTLTQKIDERSSSGEFHAETKRWFQEPGRWRIESKWSGWAPKDEGTRAIICDGTTEWNQEGNSVTFSIFIPTSVPEGLVPEPPTLDEGPPAHIYVNYQAGDGSIGLSIINSPAGSGLDADPRKNGETIKIRENIVGHFLDNEPQFGGPILWWEEAGSYVALSGPELNKTDLVNIANSMSATADLK